MRTLLGVPILAALLLTLAARQADARLCGAARYQCCVPCCDSGFQAASCNCHTVMKTCYQTVWETSDVSPHLL